MRGSLGVALAVLLAVGGVKTTAGQSPSSSPSVPTHRAALDRCCVTCHNARLRTAGLLLDQADVDHPAANAAVWEKVLHKLHAREMPPAGVPHPDDATYIALANYLEAALDDAAAAHP